MKKDQEMHWFLWEALSLEIQDMANKGIIPGAILAEASEINQITRETGVFSDELRERAIGLAGDIEPFYRQWMEAVDKEQQEMWDAS